MSVFEDALYIYHSNSGRPSLRCMRGHVRKVCNIGEDVQCGRDSKSKRSSNLEGAHWIPDFIENVVRILPSVICEKDCEHGGCVLREYQGGAYQRAIGVQTSWALLELPANA
jgi:hypothetical protein